MTATGFLARAHYVTDGATSGPWWNHGSWPFEVHGAGGSLILVVGKDGTEADAAVAAWSRTMLPAAVAAIEAVLALTFASDDGSEWPHVDGCTGEPECPACWAEGIRNAIAAHLDPS